MMLFSVAAVRPAESGCSSQPTPSTSGESRLAGQGFSLWTLATGVVYGLQPDALFVIIPALALPTKLAAAAYMGMFVAGTVAAMGSYTAFIGRELPREATVTFFNHIMCHALNLLAQSCRAHGIRTQMSHGMLRKHAGECAHPHSTDAEVIKLCI